MLFRRVELLEEEAAPLGNRGGRIDVDPTPVNAKTDVVCGDGDLACRPATATVCTRIGESSHVRDRAAVRIAVDFGHGDSGFREAVDADYAEHGKLSNGYQQETTAWYCDDLYFGVMRRYMITSGFGSGQPHNYSTEQLLMADQAANISFHLFTRQNPNVSQPLVATAGSLNASFYNGSNPTRVIVHGFCNCQHSGFCKNVKDALLYANDVNIITIDWSNAGGLLDYVLLRLRLDQVAVSLAGFIDFLHNSTEQDLGTVSLIGHSLGAHLAGLTGKRMVSGKVGSIIGLDPAGPLFSSGDPAGRLASTDADYVEVIHTNGGILGMYDPIGTADFYPNGGKHQPGCLPWLFGISCSHGRAWELYAESVYTPVGFSAVPCDNMQQIAGSVCRVDLPKVIMGGEPVNNTKAGIFVLSTNSEFPYARG
ncbi:phospholipase A1-like [Anopheles darlingi]|uniref:phospholipase A1-like n=1 Tax=Anopheles darlingi TaxID=43151 RepID=UPI002100583E|nr:phospholipase A1-like [Anopheles darlingi]